MNILALSIHDLRAPYHGGARLTLSIAGALSFEHNLLHLTINSNAPAGYLQIKTKYRSYYSSFEQFMLPVHYHSSRLYGYAEFALKKTEFMPDVILCGDRRLYALCKLLAMKFNSKVILLQDSLRYLFLIRPISAVAIPMYTVLAFNSDYSIAVSAPVERKLKMLTLNLKKIVLIRPTFMLLSNGYVDQKLEVAFEKKPLFLYTGPLDVLFVLAKKLPQVNFIATGPAAYHASRLLRDFNVKNIYLMHNIEDSILEKVSESVRASIIIRNVMTGISTTVLQSLYFGVPVIGNPTSLMGYEDLIAEKDGGEVFFVGKSLGEIARFVKLQSTIDIDYHGKRKKIRALFDQELSPFRYLKEFNKLLSIK